MKLNSYYTYDTKLLYVPNLKNVSDIVKLNAYDIARICAILESLLSLSFNLNKSIFEVIVLWIQKKQH